MKKLKKDVIKEVNKLKKDKHTKSFLNDIENAKSSEQIGVILLENYAVDIFVKCFAPEDIPICWKKWVMTDYYRVLKNCKTCSKKELEKLVKQAEAVEKTDFMEVDYQVKDIYQSMDNISENQYNMLQNKHAMHLRVITLIYDAIEAKKALIEEQMVQLDELIKKYSELI